MPEYQGTNEPSFFVFLGSKKFFMGDQPCEVDCAIFGMLTMIICNMPTSKHERYLKGA